MDYVDTILIRLADEQTRSQLFDATSLEAIASAAYHVENLGLAAPFQAIFESVQLGYSIPSISTLEGTWGMANGSERIEARLFLTGFAPPIRVDALWSGAVRAKVVPPNSTVTAVQAQPQTLEQDFAVEKVSVTYAPPGNVQPMSRILPITAAVFIRPAGFSLVQLLMDTRYVCEQLAISGLERPADPNLPMRNSIIGVWIVPASVLGDGFPGNSPQARRRAATQWLVRAGIGLVVTQ
jgi:hypothetical protein